MREALITNQRHSWIQLNMRVLLRRVPIEMIRPDHSIDETHFKLRTHINEEGLSFLSKCDKCSGSNETRFTNLEGSKGVWLCYSAQEIATAGLTISHPHKCHIEAYFKEKSTAIPQDVRINLAQAGRRCNRDPVKC